MSQNFVHLHVHTHMSVQDALPSPTELAKFARKSGFPAVAITDHGRMGGIVEFVDACRKPMDDVPLIKPILGQEFYVCKDMNVKESIIRTDGKKGRPKHNHLTLLAMNEQGYLNLLEASSIGAVEGYYYEPRIDWDVIQSHSEGVICLSGCLGGELIQKFLRGDDDGAYEVAEKYKELFGDRYYIELQHHRIQAQKEVLPKLRELAQKLDIKCVVSNDVHYLEKNDWEIHDVYIQTRDISTKNKDGMNKKREAYGTKEFYLKSEEEMRVPFGSFAPDAIENTLEIADRIEDFLKLDVPHLLPKTIIPENDSFKKFHLKNLPHNKENEAYLAYLAATGLKRLGLSGNPVYSNRLKYELKLIWYMGVVDYFLIQHEMVSFMKENGILYGIRGSGVGSLVNYCIDVCPVDPIRWNLLFERFLNPGRGTQYKIDYSCLPVSKWSESYEKKDQEPYVSRIQAIIDDKKEIDEFKQYIPEMEKELWVLENQGLAQYICDLADSDCKSEKNDSQLWCAYFMGITEQKPSGELVVSKVATLPDVDTDIDDSRRQDVIEWVKNRFGEDHVCSIGTRGTYKARAAVTNSLKVSSRFREQWGEQVPSKATAISQSIPAKISSTATILEARAESYEFDNYAKQYEKEMYIADKMMGKISHTGVHAAGILVSSKPISHSCPIERSKDKLCSGFDMSAVERVGLVKYDYLGMATYQMLYRALALIEKRHGEKLDLTKIEFDDKNIYKLYTDGQTSTLFQCASDGMTGVLKDIGVDCMEELIAIIALYRPGPEDFIPLYSSSKRNPFDITYSHPIIEKYLSVTYGVMVYQEQAMFLARELAGLNWIEVDKLRKAISKKQGKEFDASCALFERKALANGIPEAAVSEVLRLMAKFGGYAFNRSHSCAYAILSYWTAYLRYHYPAEWLAACMHVDRDDETKIVRYKRECNTAGIKVINPNVNDSGFETTVAGSNVIALPLNSLKGVGDMAKTIVLNQPFDSLKDFIVRAKPNRGLVVALVQGGALSCFGEVRKLGADSEEIMQLYDNLADERKLEEKKLAKEAKMKYKSLSPMHRMKNEKKELTGPTGVPLKSARIMF